MPVRRRVLLVSPTNPLSRTLSRCVRHAGYEVTVVTTFQAARTAMLAPPDLLITELKLGAHNGLQLALRLAPAGVPSIVVADRGFEHEVEQLGAVWLSSDTAASDELPAVIARLIQGSGSTHHVYPWYDGGDRESITGLQPVAPTETVPRILH